MIPELQGDMRKRRPANDGQYDYYANDNDNDNHQGNVDNGIEDDEYIYVRLRKSELLLDNGSSPGASLSLRQPSHTTRDNSNVDTLPDVMTNTVRPETLHRESIPRPRRSATERWHGDPAVDLTPALHDLGCGFGPLPMHRPTSSPSSRQQQSHSPIIDASSDASNSLVVSNSSDVLPQRDLAVTQSRRTNATTTATVRRIQTRESNHKEEEEAHTTTKDNTIGTGQQ
jgi:hypothetical protein